MFPWIIVIEESLQKEWIMLYKSVKERWTWVWIASDPLILQQFDRIVKVEGLKNIPNKYNIIAPHPGKSVSKSIYQTLSKYRDSEVLKLNQTQETDSISVSA